ncbi:hypothetical protein DID88_010448 [Monilinia fructigena]|uniref:DUF7102 domain-containing protein n=1 Tax=Monilinia fructigena TaxID=38457 RepID=A0A395IRY2_9HELO|nr:hypothetical protein DID88_010448 [Monilinia fructigena]
MFTPPLSPISAPVPDSPLLLLPSAFEIPLLSDPDSLTSLDLKIIENEVFKEDLPTPIRNRYSTQTIPAASGGQLVKPVEIYSPPEDIKYFNESSSSPLQKKRVVLADLKVEEPLTPLKPPLEESRPKSVHFSNIVEELLLSSRPQSGFSEAVLETKFFEEAFGESGDQANHRAEQERLVDTRKSVNAVSSILQRKIEEVGIDRSERWPGLKKLHVKLPWAPFKHDLGSVVGESLGNDDIWKSFVHDTSDEMVITSSRILPGKWKGCEFFSNMKMMKRMNLRLVISQKEVEDISSIIRKRKSEMEDVRASTKGKNENTNPTLAELRVQVDHLLTTPDMRHDKSRYQEDTASNVPKRARPAAREQISLLGEPAAPETHVPLPAPIVVAPETSISIIVSSTLLRNRLLVRSLQSLLPTLKICERDFSAHNTTIWNHGSVIRSSVTSTLTYEADIIISPTTGLILTTLQHIKQKPLPGHKTAVPIRDRLEKASGRYENLIILVSSPPIELGDSDCIAWANFVGFTLTLQAGIIVNYILVDSNNPDDQVMAKYISALIIQHLPPSSYNLETSGTRILLGNLAKKSRYERLCGTSNTCAPEGSRA